MERHNGVSVGMAVEFMVLASAEGMPAAAMRPFMAPTALREFVRVEAELKSEAVIDDLEAAVDTEYEIFTEEDKERIRIPVPASSARLRLAVTAVMAVTVTALALIPRAAALDVIQAVWKEVNKP